MTATPLDRSVLHKRLAEVPRGRWIMYHVGYLPVDRLKDERLSEMATDLYTRARAGDLFLVQGKSGPGKYAYYVVKR